MQIASLWTVTLNLVCGPALAIRCGFSQPDWKDPTSGISPAPEHKRYHTELVWLAKFVKHFTDFLHRHTDLDDTSDAATGSHIDDDLDDAPETEGADEIILERAGRSRLGFSIVVKQPKISPIPSTSEIRDDSPIIVIKAKKRSSSSAWGDGTIGSQGRPIPVDNDDVLLEERATIEAFRTRGFCKFS
ncbi:MAG: hypothetical protein M1816_007210 [Peltula sp. TS41687]|nr:MAG: hypothetical protein M1816_007210 [Peltula sp. TS41687]